MLAMPGTSAVPAVPGWSPYLISVVHRPFARPQVTAKYHALGSMVSMAPEDIAAVRSPVAKPGLGGPELLVVELLQPPDETPLLPPHAAIRSGIAAVSAIP